MSLGNTLLNKRVVTTCTLDKRQPVILRADLSAETVAFRARFDGPYDFEPFTPPAVVTIALDSSALFDTGKSVLKPDARTNLHEAAQLAQKAIALAPNKAACHVTLSQVYAAAGLDLNARRELETAARLAPENATIQALLARGSKG